MQEKVILPLMARVHKKKAYSPPLAVWSNIMPGADMAEAIRIRDTARFLFPLSRHDPDALAVAGVTSSAYP